MRRSLIDARVRYLAILALPFGCGGSEQSGVPAGLIVAPMVASGVASAKLPADGGADAATTSVAHLPFPSEPRPPTNQSNCIRKVDCRPEEDDAPSMAYPSPFE